MTKQQLNTAVDCVLFDLDGTLVDTAPDFLIVVNQLLAEHKAPPMDETAVRQTVSDGARALIKLMFAIDEGDEHFPSLLQRLLELYGIQIKQTQAELYQGMDELLTQLDNTGIPWGIVTNKPEPYAVPLLSKLNLLERCGVLVCPEHVKERKPSAEPILLACERLKRSPRRAVYFGDHERDMQAAKNAGAIAIAATYGYLHQGAEPERWQADFLMHQPDRAAALLNKIPAA